MRARFERRENRDDVVRAAGKLDGDRGFSTCAAGGKRAGQPVGRRVELAVAQCPARPGDGRVVGCLRGDRSEPGVNPLRRRRFRRAGAQRRRLIGEQDADVA